MTSSSRYPETNRDPRPPPETGEPRFALPDALPASALTESGYAELVGPNILSFEHWQRLGDGELYAHSSRVDWATLLRRTFATDVRICARCGGNLSVRAVVTDPDAIARLLTALRRARDPPVAA
jgi:hypothetical protein